MEQDLKQKLTEISQHLAALRKSIRPSFWRVFLNGALTGMGSIVGVVVALTILGWILNQIGLIPAFRSQVSELKQSLEKIQKSR